PRQRPGERERGRDAVPARIAGRLRSWEVGVPGAPPRLLVLDDAGLLAPDGGARDWRRLRGGDADRRVRERPRRGRARPRTRHPTHRPAPFPPSPPPGAPCRCGAGGSRASARGLTIETVGEVMGPEEARLALGPDASAALRPSAPVVVVRARLPEPTFASEGR